MGYQEWDEILMITLISSKNIGVYKIMRNTAWQVFYRFKKGEVVISKKRKKNASFQWKSVYIYRIFRNFDDYPDFQQKARGM